jgi:maleate isomerase
VVTSAGALVDGLKRLRATRVAMVSPYLKPLTALVCDYIQAEGIEVADRVSLEIADNVEVGRQNPMALLDIYKRLDLTGVDALVLSSCVQMPSLAAIPIVEKETGLPVVSAAACTTYAMLDRLGLKRHVPEAGTLLAGDL